MDEEDRIAAWCEWQDMEERRQREYQEMVAAGVPQEQSKQSGRTTTTNTKLTIQAILLSLVMVGLYTLDGSWSVLPPILAVSVSAWIMLEGVWKKRQARQLIVPPPQPRTIVVALNYRTFVCWCRENDRNPRARDLIFVSTSTLNHGERLLGIQLTKHDKIIKYDHYYEGRYTANVMELLETRRTNG